MKKNYLKFTKNDYKMFIYRKIKRIFILFLLRYKWKGKCKFASHSIISLESKFEGMSEIGSNVYYTGFMGFGSYIGPNSRLSADIGRFTSIAEKAVIIRGRHPYKEPFATCSPRFFSIIARGKNTFATEQMCDEYKPYDTKRNISVKIGSDCWLGHNVSLIEGIVINDGVIVLAGAIVTKDVPAYAIVGGVPAQILGYRYNKETIEFLQKIKWWDNSIDWFRQHWNLLCDIEKLKEFYCKDKL